MSFFTQSNKIRKYQQDLTVNSILPSRCFDVMTTLHRLASPWPSNHLSTEDLTRMIVVAGYMAVVAGVADMNTAYYSLRILGDDRVPETSC